MRTNDPRDKRMTGTLTDVPSLRKGSSLRTEAFCSAPLQSAFAAKAALRACRVVAAEPVDEQSDHSPRVAIIFGWHAQACDRLEKVI
jgi:hypothetical protein